MRVLILADNGFEDMELFYPLYRFREEGAKVTIAAPTSGRICGKNGYVAEPLVPFSKVHPEEFDVLVIPGGKAPEHVRLEKEALKIVNHFFEAAKPVGAICHGAQVLISAGRVKGKKATCWKGIRDDLIAAGARYEDREVVVDGNLVTSRFPDDLPAFMRELLKLATKRR